MVSRVHWEQVAGQGVRAKSARSLNAMEDDWTLKVFKRR